MKFWIVVFTAELWVHCVKRYKVHSLRCQTNLKAHYASMTTPDHMGAEYHKKVHASASGERHNEVQSNHPFPQMLFHEAYFMFTTAKTEI